MKRVGYIYEEIYDIENIMIAIERSSQGKRKQRHVRKVLNNKEYYARQIQKMLKDETYRPNRPKRMKIFDGANQKERIIYKPQFYPDHIIHWCLLLRVERIFSKSMYEYNCGSVPKRGTTFAQNTLRKWLDKDYRGTKWCLKLDVKKFYPSINNEILKIMFRRKIKDKKCLRLIDRIIDVAEGQPIGFYTSQWFSNFFLEGLDHYIKQELKIKYYVRYVDDLVLLDSNKRKLHKARIAIQEYLETIDLELKGNWQVFNIKDRAIDFLGFRFYRDKTTLRKRNSLRIKRRANKIAKKSYLNERDARALLSYWGWIKRSDSFYFYQKYVKPKVSVKKARKVVSINDRIREDDRKRRIGTSDERSRRIQAD